MYSILHREEQAHDNAIASLAVSKGPDGTDCIITGSMDDTVKVWQWNDEQLNLRYIFEGHALGVIAVDVNAEGNLVASSSLDSHIRLWDLVSGQSVLNIDNSSVGSWKVVFSPDSKVIAASTYEAKINLYDVETGQLVNSLGTPKFTLAIAFSPDGKYIACGAIDGMIQIFDRRTTSDSLVKTSEGHAMPARSVAFSYDSKYLASGSDDWHIKLLDMTSKINKSYMLSGHSSWVTNVTFSPDNKHFASSSCDKTVKIWEVDNTDAIKTFKEHKDQVWGCEYNSDGSHLVSAGDDQCIVIYSTDICLKKSTQNGKNGINDMDDGNENNINTKIKGPEV